MELQLIRHATSKLRLNNFTFLVDPMFGEKGVMDPVGNAANTLRNPLVELPLPVEEILKDIDAILITHSHRDHFDDKAMEVIPRTIPIFCQPEDVGKLLSLEFTNVIAVDKEIVWNDVRLSRTGGQHGTGDLGKQMGPVSGFVLEVADEPVIYIAGDTIWCGEVEDALRKYSPEVIVLNGGEAQFLTGDPITMGCEDVQKVSQSSPDAKIVVVHMESWNHCLLTRDMLKEFVRNNQLQNVIVPANGENVVSMK